ncbi:methyltransferase [Serratia sp. S1B]|nr:methyltransferase [Serratia sp. S1B]
MSVGSAHADTVDVSSVVTTITGFVATVSAIGLAVLSLIVTGKVFKWVRTVI